MPLDPIAERYAQTLFTDETERLAQEHSARKSQAIGELAKRNILPNTAGHFHSEMSRLGIEYIEALANARVNSLLAAHEQAHVPIDDQAVTDIHRAAVGLCEAQGRNLTTSTQQQIAQAGMPANMASAMAGTIASAMTGIEARVYRRLATKRDEQIMANRPSRPATSGSIAAANTTMQPANPLRQSAHKGEKLAAFAFGVTFVLLMLYINIYLPNPTETQWFTFRVVLALAAAGVGALLPGLLWVTVPSYVRAGGALALFIVVYWFNPPRLVTAPRPAATQLEKSQSTGPATTTGSESPAITGKDNQVTYEQPAASPQKKDTAKK